MADQQAKITSLDVLDTFRARLIIFMSKTRQALDQATDEVRRTKQWLHHDQRVHWEAEHKKRLRKLDQAEGELMSARLSEFVESPTMQQRAVRKARESVAEAEEKLRSVKRCARSFDEWVDPHIRKLEALRQFAEQDVPDAIAWLVQAQRTLEDYSRMPHPSSKPAERPAAVPPPAPADS